MTRLTYGFAGYEKSGHGDMLSCMAAQAAEGLQAWWKVVLLVFVFFDLVGRIFLRYLYVKEPWRIVSIDASL